MSFEVVPQDEAWVKQAKQNLTALYEHRPMARVPFEFVPCDVTGEYAPKELEDYERMLSFSPTYS